MNYVMWDDGASLYHYGIPGQKWGNRRFQNHDGSLTAEGRQRYGVGERLYGKGRFGTKGYVSRATKKAVKGSKSYEANKAYDKKIEEYYNKASIGKNAIKDYLLGTSGTMTYNMARSLGETRGKAFVRSVFDINLGRFAGSTVGSSINNFADSRSRPKYDIDAWRENGGWLDDYTIANPKAKAIKAAGRITGMLGSKAVERAARNSGAELSLQQRALRKKATRRSR